MYPIYLTLFLLFFFILSLYVFYIYYRNNVKLFIGNINPKLYLLSVILCILLFLPFIYYINIIKLRNNEINQIFINLFLMILGFIMWMISIYYKKVIFRTFFILVIIFANINLINIIYKKMNMINTINNKVLQYITIIGLCYLLFHHVFIDFILWNYIN
jgi:hypothetical protein